MKVIYQIINIIKKYNAKQRYLLGFGTVVVILALVRLFCPGVAESKGRDQKVQQTQADSVVEDVKVVDAVISNPDTVVNRPDTTFSSRFFDKDGKEVKHRIFSVPHFGNTFPDENDVQLLAAGKYGVQPVQNREDAEKRKNELVYIGSNPYFYVDKLNNSVPYLVPRAAVLLQDIGRVFYDSLQIKGVPLHQIIVTSVLRTKEDVGRLQRRNQNAKSNSCHLYGTTFDICYNRYQTVQTEKEPRRKVQNDTLKWVLSEVLRDVREQNRALIKYEVKQGCFHITVN